MDDAHLVEDAVHRRYAELAVVATGGGVACCGDEGEACFGPSGYGQEELGQLPQLAANASPGEDQAPPHGNPSAMRTWPTKRGWPFGENMRRWSRMSRLRWTSH